VIGVLGKSGVSSDNRVSSSDPTVNPLDSACVIWVGVKPIGSEQVLPVELIAMVGELLTMLPICTITGTKHPVGALDGIVKLI
jgi:hypothetical protein